MSGIIQGSTGKTRIGQAFKQKDYNVGNSSRGWTERCKGQRENEASRSWTPARNPWATGQKRASVLEPWGQGHPAEAHRASLVGAEALGLRHSLHLRYWGRQRVWERNTLASLFLRPSISLQGFPSLEPKCWPTGLRDWANTMLRRKPLSNARGGSEGKGEIHHHDVQDTIRGVTQCWGLHLQNTENQKDWAWRLERAWVVTKWGRGCSGSSNCGSKVLAVLGKRAGVLVRLRRSCIGEEETGVGRALWGYKSESLKESGFQSDCTSVLKTAGNKMVLSRE